MHAQVEFPEWISHVQTYLNTILPQLVDTIYHRIQAANATQPPSTQYTLREVCAFHIFIIIPSHAESTGANGQQHAK